ncbi:MAG: HDOD domain-containing protein [Gemmatimonadota bacterium]
MSSPQLTRAAAPPDRGSQQVDASDDESPVKARLRQILEGSDFPALSQQIMATISALDDDLSSLQRLANVVLREYSLTLSVVRTANSAHYRRSGKPIQSAMHAMMMLGARTVRMIAGSLLLFENFHRRSDGLKELMLLSLITANHARETSSKLGRSDPEEAHLCGMFRNLGEVLVACHFPDDYTRIVETREQQGLSFSAATFHVLGFRFEDLGIEVSKHWGMPDTVVQGIRARAGSPTSDAGAITAFSHDLTAAIYRRDGDANGGDARRALDEVIERHAPRLKITREQVHEVVEAALVETRELFASANVSINALRMRQLSAEAHSALGMPPVTTGEWSVVEGDAAANTEPPVPSLPELRERLLQETESKVDPASEADVGQVLLLALEGALRGGPFDRVVACVLSADRTRLVARSGLGAGVEALTGQFDFPMTPRGGPVVSLLMQRQPLLLPFSRTMSITESRWAGAIGARDFGVFPIVVSGRIVGCLYGDRVYGERALPSPDRSTIAHLVALCNLVVRAIDSRRAAAAQKSSPSAQTSTFTAEAKAALVLRGLRGESTEELAASAGIPAVLLEQWKREFMEAAIARMGQTS